MNMARLIDADALIRSVCHKCNDVNYDDPCEPGDCALYYAVHNAPTVDAVPVVHGRWIWTETGEQDYEQFWVCSECGEHTYFVTNYCCDCGARMDQEVE